MQFFRKVLILVSGNIINQVVLILSYPIISRIFQPQDFGVYEQVNAILLIFLLLSSLRYESAILIATNDQEGRNLQGLSIIILVGLTVLVFLLILVFRTPISYILNNDNLKGYLFWIPPLLIIGGTRQIYYNWIIRKKGYHLANISNILNSSTNSIFRVITGFLYLHPLSLFVSRVVSFTLSLYALIKRDGNRLINLVRSKEITLEKMTIVAKTYKDFPLFMSGGMLLNRLSTSITPLILSNFFGVTFLGYYAMANTALNIPVSILRRSFNTVFLQESAELKNKGGPVSIMLKQLTVYIFLAGIFPTLIITFYGPSLFSFVLGVKWRMSGEIASLIISWLFITLVAAPSNAVVPVLNLQRFYIGFQTVLVVSRILVMLYLFNSLETIKAVITGLAIHGVVFNILLVSCVIIKARKIEASKVN